MPVANLQNGVMASSDETQLPSEVSEARQGLVPGRQVGAVRDGHPPLDIVDPVFDPCPVCEQAVTSVHFDGLDSGTPFTWVGPCEHRVQNSSADYETVPTRTYDIRFRHFTYEAFAGG
jgi:hypothetical protein